MIQVNTWGMTGNIETFRQGATAFRNARDWAKEQRDEAIERANERVNDIPSTTRTSSALASSFSTEVSNLVALPLSIAAESQSQESPPTQIAASFTSEISYQDCETSTDELAIDMNPPAKRSSRSHHSRHRKRNTGASSARRSSTAKGTGTQEQ
jgi:hypothetical protein